jgi:hypothetical protein
VDSGPGSPGGEEEREYKAWKKSLLLVLSQVDSTAAYYCQSSFKLMRFMRRFHLGQLSQLIRMVRYPVG